MLPTLHESHFHSENLCTVLSCVESPGRNTSRRFTSVRRQRGVPSRTLALRCPVQPAPAGQDSAAGSAALGSCPGSGGTALRARLPRLTHPALPPPASPPPRFNRPLRPAGAIQPSPAQPTPPRAGPVPARTACALTAAREKRAGVGDSPVTGDTSSCPGTGLPLGELPTPGRRRGWARRAPGTAARGHPSAALTSAPRRESPRLLAHSMAAQTDGGCRWCPRQETRGGEERGGEGWPRQPRPGPCPHPRAPGAPKRVRSCSPAAKSRGRAGGRV